MKDFFGKCDQIRRKLRICPQLQKKFSMENFILCAINFIGSEVNGLSRNTKKCISSKMEHDFLMKLKTF